jgi:hypothetical protein
MPVRAKRPQTEHEAGTQSKSGETFKPQSTTARIGPESSGPVIKSELTAGRLLNKWLYSPIQKESDKRNIFSKLIHATRSSQHPVPFFEFVMKASTPAVKTIDVKCAPFSGCQASSSTTTILNGAEIKLHRHPT